MVPCYNEQESISRLQAALLECEQRLLRNYDIDFVIVDDGSTDGTLSALREAFVDRPNYLIAQHVENAGIAAAIMTGIRESQTEIVCSIDSDCTYDPLQLEQLLPLMTDDVDLVTASPYHPEGKVLNLAKWRLALSWLASFIYGQVMRLDIHTYTSCFRVYRRSSIGEVQLENEGFTGIPELLWRVSQNGGVIVECPAVLKAREQGNSKMRILTVSLGHLRLLSQILFCRVSGFGAKQQAEPT